MGTINIQMWQLLLFIAVTWLWGYLFGFFRLSSVGKTWTSSKSVKLGAMQMTVLRHITGTV